MGILERIDKPGFASSKEFVKELATGIKEEIDAAVQPLLDQIAALKSGQSSTSGTTPAPTPSPAIAPSPSVPETAAVLAFVQPITLSVGGTINTPATVSVTGTSSVTETGLVKYPVGSSVTVDVTGIDPNVTFDGWRQDSVNGPTLSGFTPFVTTVPSGGLTLVAVFKEQLRVTGGSGGGSGGSGGGGGGSPFDELGGGTRLFT